MLERLIGKPSFSYIVNSSSLKPDTNKRNYKELFGNPIPTTTDEGETFALLPDNWQ